MLRKKHLAIIKNKSNSRIFLLPCNFKKYTVIAPLLRFPKLNICLYILNLELKINDIEEIFTKIYFWKYLNKFNITADIVKKTFVRNIFIYT